MAAESKRRKAARQKVDANKTYQSDYALGLVKELATGRVLQGIGWAVDL